MKNPNYVMRNITAKRKDIYWLLVLGTGGDTCELDSTTNVTIMREVPYKEMPMMYSAADFMILPSAYEGFGLVIIEAMSCGVPVITTNVGIATKIYRQKPFDMLLIPDIHAVDDGDLTIVMDKIDVLKNDNTLREEISKCGIIFVHEKFSLEKWKREMERVLEVS